MTTASRSCPRSTVDLPPGFTAQVAGVPLCPEANAAAGTCGADSRVGSVVVGAGAGSSPVDVPGTAYLAGPYKGAPFSLVFVVPREGRPDRPRDGRRARRDPA